MFLSDPRIILYILLLLLLRPFFMNFRFEVVVVAGNLFRDLFVEHHWSVGLNFLRSIEELQRIIVELFVIIELFLAQYKYFRVSSKVVRLILVPLSSFLSSQVLPFFGSVLLSLAGHHSLLNLFVPSDFHLFLPFLGSIHKIQSIGYQIFLDMSVERSISSETGCVVDFE